MTKRKYYPIPSCPHCGKGESWVTDTRYTSEEIIRVRLCGFCDRKWWTRQGPEESIDPGKECIEIPASKNIAKNGRFPSARVIPVN